MVVLALVGVLGAAVSSALVHQQRFFMDARDEVEVREGVRDAIEVLAADIRGSSTTDTIRLMADSAIELFTSIGLATVCRQASASGLVLAEEGEGGNTMSSMLVQPDTGDIALLYQPAQRRWERHRVAGFWATSGASACIPDSGGPGEGFLLTLASFAPDSIRPGTPVRFLRRGRYSLYRSSDAQWYLGYRRCNTAGQGVCGTVQPLSGPYRRYNTDPLRTGFLFEYFAADGTKLSGVESATAVARIDVTVRAGKTAPRRIGGQSRAVADSGRISIALRNR